MAIEKMTFLHLSGPSSTLDETLLLCLRSGLFQPEHTRKLSEYSVGANPLTHNPYAAPLALAEETAERLGLEARALPGAFPQPPGEVVEEASARIAAFAKRYPRLFAQKQKLAQRAEFLERALAALVGFRDAPPMREGTRFGLLPRTGYAMLRDRGSDAPITVQGAEGSVWCFHTADEADADEVYRAAGFQRVRLHDPPQGEPVDAAAYFREGIMADLEHDRKTCETIERTIRSEREEFERGLHDLRVLHDAFALRGYAVLLHDRFHLIGYVLTGERERFLEALAPLEGRVEIEANAARDDVPHLKVPVKLKNNWLTRPFEMFVTMYGSPSYNDIDPTPFVAYSYCLLFGVMFGDLGQGLCIALLGLYLHHRRRMPLGGVMSRIGCSSMVFGVLYGSVFGFEEALDWFWVGVVGLHEKPIEVLRSDMTNTILISAIGLGCAIILLAILFNIVTGLKHRDPERVLLSHNGLPGLVFYSAVLFAVVMQFTGTPVLNGAYGFFLIALPLIVMFLGEPIGRLAGYFGKGSVLQRHQRLQESRRFDHIDVDLGALFHSRFVHATFGRLPTDSYEKMGFYTDEPFVLHPIKSDRDYIWCVYAMAETDKEQIDAIFHDLYFERIYIPEEELASIARTEEFIRSCIDAEEAPTPVREQTDNRQSRRKTAFQHVFPEGVGGFFTQSFFEMFEVLLSFVTNTMSFLRVGGFILSHAGMMSVVFTLAAMAGSGAAGPVILIVGNLFVMGLEGLIVGIQALRLEFYEIFSRFFDADGAPFSPVAAGQRAQS